MRTVVDSEEALHFIPVSEGGDAVRARARRAPLCPYRLALGVLDISLCLIAFWVAALSTGLALFVGGRPAECASLLLLSLMLIVFFPTYHLYSYHHIFLFKNHLANLSKAIFWGALTLGMIFALHAYSHLLDGTHALVLVLAGAVVVLLLSTFYWTHLINFLKAMGVSFVFTGIMALLIPDEKPAVLLDWNTVLRGVFLALGLFLLMRFSLVHVVFNKWLRRHFRRQVVIVGTDEEARRITGHVVGVNAPFWVAGFLGDPEDSSPDMPANKNRLGSLSELPKIIEQEKVDELVVTDETMDKAVLVSLLDYCTTAGLTVWFPPKVMPIINMKLYIDTFCGLPMIRLCSQKHNWFSTKAKYALDALVALPATLMLLPVFGIIAVAIKLDSKGPVFYKAAEIGKNGNPFTMYKFRSMRCDTGCENHKEFVTRLIKGEIRPDGEANTPLKITDDPRVTFVGRLLRKSSMDELPQLLNVLKGEMSLVGPRPCLPYEFEIYKEWHKKRFSVRPGITGLWQVAGRSAVAFEDMILLDLYYIYNRSLSLDLNILYETMFAVLASRGAY